MNEEQSEKNRILNPKPKGSSTRRHGGVTRAKTKATGISLEPGIEQKRKRCPNGQHFNKHLNNDEGGCEDKELKNAKAVDEDKNAPALVTRSKANKVDEEPSKAFDIPKAKRCPNGFRRIKSNCIPYSKNENILPTVSSKHNDEQEYADDDVASSSDRKKVSVVKKTPILSESENLISERNTNSDIDDESSSDDDSTSSSDDSTSSSDDSSSSSDDSSSDDESRDDNSGDDNSGDDNSSTSLPYLIPINMSSPSPENKVHQTNNQQPSASEIEQQSDGNENNNDDNDDNNNDDNDDNNNYDNDDNNIYEEERDIEDDENNKESVEPNIYDEQDEVEKLKTNNKLSCKNRIRFKQRQRGDIDCPLDLTSGQWEMNMYDDYNYANSGRQYRASAEVFKIQGKQILDPMWAMEPGKESTEFTSTTYIYIISKTINRETFYKVGEGGKGGSATVGTGRLGDAQTYLIPGSIDAGFLVHYLMFFRKNFHVDSKYIGQHVEKQIHATLQNIFPASSISFSNDNPSEWYSIKDEERNFFFGFIFDIVASFPLKKTKPLKITRISPDDKDEDVILPSKEEIIKRMVKNPKFAKELKKIETYNLRHMQSLAQILIDKNPQKEININLSKLRNIYVKKDITLERPFFTESARFVVTEIKKQINRAETRGLSPNTIYVTLQKSNAASTNDKPVIHDKQKVLEGLLKKFEPIYYIDISSFLENLYPFENHRYSNEEKESLDELHDFFTDENYKDNQIEVPIPERIYPSFYLEKSFQDKIGNSFVDDNSTWKIHDDLSIEIDGNTDEQDDLEITDETPEQIIEEPKPREIINSWKVLQYDPKTKTITRIKYDRIASAEVKGAEPEVIPVLRLMFIADVQQPIAEKSKKRKGKSIGPINNKDPWKPDSWKKIDGKGITISKQLYEIGDIVSIKNSQFISIIDDEPSINNDGEKTYKIKGIYNDSNLDNLTLNPIIVVKRHTEGKPEKQNEESFSTSANIRQIEGKIKLLTKKPLVKPTYKDGNVLKIQDYDNIQSNDIDLLKWKAIPQHFVKIIRHTDTYYGISFFAPYDNPVYWDSTQEEKYIIDIEIGKLEKDSTLVNDNDMEEFNVYKMKLPFLISGIEKITSHLPPKEKDRKNVKTYKVQWAVKSIGLKMEPTQSSNIMESYATAAVDLYWEKKVAAVDPKILFNADNIDDNDIKKFAEKNGFDILQKNEENFKDQKNGKLFSMKIQSRHEGFNIGDIFVIGENHFLLSYFKTIIDSKEVKSYKYGLWDEQNGKVKEYTYPDLHDILETSLKNLQEIYIIGENDLFYKEMMDRHKKILLFRQRHERKGGKTCKTVNINNLRKTMKKNKVIQQ